MRAAAASLAAFPDPEKLNHERCKVIKISDCVQIPFIPVEPLLKIPNLTSIECQATTLLWPPLKVIAQGGGAVIDFLRVGKCVLESQPGLEFPSLDFLSEAHIMHLDLSRTFGGGSPPEDSLLPVSSSLVSLSARDCKWIENASFIRVLKNVQSIDLSGCTLLGPVIPLDVFEHLNSLTSMSLERFEPHAVALGC